MNTKKILLISPKVSNEIALRVPVKLQENLGIGYLASFLEEKSIGVDIIDFNVHSEKNLEDVLKDFPCLIGISIHSKDDLKEAIVISEILKKKEKNVHITCGGHYASKNDITLLNFSNCIDSVVRGEGEITLYELYCSLKNQNLQNIEGLTYKLNGTVIKNKERKIIEDLDTFPFPKRYNLENIKNQKEKPFKF